jgi:hypothetical protein
MGGTAHVILLGGEFFLFHDDAVGTDICAWLDVCTIHHDGTGSCAAIGAQVDMVHFEHAIFEAMRLKVAGDCGIIFEMEHIWIDDLRKTCTQHHALANAYTHRT